jgi:hypothetical protein
MAAVIQTPLLGSDCIELGNQVWRKRLLPVGSVEYQGRVLKFDRSYLNALADSFRSGAYDQVPLQLADARNTHTNDPERTRGWVQDMSVDDSGLWVTVTTTDAGSQLLAANPKLGVSARIVEDYARADGKYFPAAIQHVLGTLDPRIPGLGAWEAVTADLSNGPGADMVIDLSTSSWAGEPGYSPCDFAGDDDGHPLAGKLRALSKTLAARHPDLGAADHVADAASMMDAGMHDAAKRHLRAAIGNFTPQSLTRHGLLDDDERNQAKASMDDVHRHLLLVQQDQDEQDAQATDRQPDVKARTDVTQPIPPGSQRMGTYSNDYDDGVYDFADAAGADDSDNGLTPRGQGIYKKLISKGVKPAVAMAMAKRAQNTKRGAQLSNAGYADFSQPGRQIEMAFAQAQQREAEDQARPLRRKGGTSGVSEDRLAYAMDRLSRHTYMPTQVERSMGFAGDGGGYSGGQGCGCGATRDDGSTASRYHTAGCEHAMSGDDQAQFATAGVLSEIAAEPWADDNGTQWADQDGYAMSLSEHVEALTGQRITRDPFEGLQRRELSTPQRDFDGGVRGLAAAMGLGDRRAAREESQRRAFDHMVNRPAARYRTIGEAMERGESTRERRERLRQPFGSGLVPTTWGDGVALPGELTGFTRAEPGY